MKQTLPGKAKIYRREKPKSALDEEKLRCVAPVFNRRTKSGFRLLTLPKTNWNFEKTVAQTWPGHEFVFSSVIENADARRRAVAMAKKLTGMMTNAEFAVIRKSDLEEASLYPVLKSYQVVILEYGGSWNPKYLNYVDHIMRSRALAVGGWLLVIFALKPVKLTAKTAKDIASGASDIFVAEKGSFFKSTGIPGAIVTMCDEDYNVVLEPTQPLITYTAALQYPNVILGFKRTK